MLEAKPQPALDAFYYFLMRRVLRRRFAGILARGLEHLDALDPQRSVLICANHSNWWDGFVARLLSSHIARPRRYLMQEEANLRRYPFFRACGVFGIDQRKPSAGLRYSAKLLKDPATQLWMFPQGALLPTAAPLELRDGAAFLTRLSGAQVLPLAIRYEWLIESKPTILIEIGAPLPGCGCTTTGLKTALEAVIQAPAQQLLRHETLGYTALLPPRMSINRLWDYAWHRLRGQPSTTFKSRNG